MLQPLSFVMVVACLALCKAANLQLYPWLHSSTLTVHEPALAKWGDLVQHVPTAVSHQSSSIVHSSAARITPLLAPAVRTYAASASAVPLPNAAAFVHAHAYPAWTYRSAPLLYTAPLYRN